MSKDLNEIGVNDEFVHQYNTVPDNTFSVYEIISKKVIHDLRKMVQLGKPMSDILEYALIALRPYGLELGEERSNIVLGYKIAALFSAAFGQPIFSYKPVIAWTEGGWTAKQLEDNIGYLFRVHYECWKNYMGLALSNE